MLLRSSGAALSYNCSGGLFAVTGANGAGETFGYANSLLRVSPATGQASTVCTFASTDRVQVGAFMDATTFAHFFGSSPPKMETLALVGQSGPCRATYVVSVQWIPCAAVVLPAVLLTIAVCPDSESRRLFG